MELSGGFESALWDQIVLQTCGDASIRKLAVAVAALRLANNSSLRGEKQRHHHYALEQYGKALAGFQKLVAEGENQLRKMLIAALIIFVFESTYGDTQRAVARIQSALGLINQRMTSSRPINGRDRSSHAKFQCLVEDEVLKSFMTLDRPAVGLLSGNRNNVPHRNELFGFERYLDNFTIPDTFSSINQARDCYQRIRYKMIPAHEFEARLQKSSSLPLHTSTPGIVLFRMLAELMETEGPVIQKLWKQWHRAFLPLLNNAREDPTAKDFIPATMTYIQVLSLELVLNGSIASSDTSISLALAREQVKLSRNLVARSDFPKSFVFELGIIPPMWFVVVLGPDMSLRREATAILKSMAPKVECVWDSQVIARAAEDILNKSDSPERVLPLRNAAGEGKGPAKFRLPTGAGAQYY